MKSKDSFHCANQPVCRLGGEPFPLAIAVALGAALSVSNGPAVGIAVGAGLAIVSWTTRKR